MFEQPQVEINKSGRWEIGVKEENITPIMEKPEVRKAIEPGGGPGHVLNEQRQR